MRNQHSLPPLSEIFYAITRDAADPPAAFETAAGGQQAVMPEDPVDPPSTDAAVGVATPVPSLTAAITLPSTTAVSEHPAPTSPLAPSVADSITPTANSVTPAPLSTVTATPIPNDHDLDDDNDEHDSTTTKGPKRLSMFSTIGIAFGALAFLSLLVFLLLDPRVSRGCRRQRVNSRGLGKRPISSWFPFPSSPSPPSVSRVSRKAVSNNSRRNLDLLETSERSGGSLLTYPYPRSKFSISSSEYSQMSASTTDTILAENTRANLSIPPTPTRPPRPPTADSPGIISCPTFLAAMESKYIDPAFDNGGVSPNTVSMTTLDMVIDESPLLPPNMFFTLTSPSFSSSSTLQPDTRINEEPIRPMDSPPGRLDLAMESSRHTRVQSAPGLMPGGAFDEGYPPLHLDPVARRVLMHRRSRSASGWAYRRPEREGGESGSDSEDSTYNGVFGQAL
ncbi:hypothetical protein MD484_g5615, partial [Candolleomyces efflorescens]